MRSRTASVVVLLIAGLFAASASAQITQGRLAGLVTDTQGAVLPGVTVSVTSTALIGVQSTVSQADGRYLFPALPSGTYKVNFELSGFQKLSRDNVQVVLGQTISIDAQLPIASLAETVLVTGASPVIDATTTKVGTDLKGDSLMAVPNSTDVWGALSECPASACRASTSAAATRASSPDTKSSAFRIRRASSPTASITLKAWAAPASTRTTSPTKKCRSAHSAPTSK
jgi:hypothetical protein